jgi:hypothetical protein
MIETALKILAVIILFNLIFFAFKYRKTIKLNLIIITIGIISLLILIYLNRSDELDKILSKEPIYIEITKNAVEVNYEELARFTKKYDGKAIIVTGKVSQIFDNGVRIDMTKGQFGIWKNSIYIYIDMKDMEKDFKLLDDDIIKVVGIGRGERTFLNIFKNKQSIPTVEAITIDLFKATN